MLPIVSVVGDPASEKSALADSLAGELGKRGLRVTLVRQDGPGPGYADAARRLADGDLDLVIVDGVVNDSDPRIELHTSGDGPVTDPDKLLAVVSNFDLKIDCPRFAPDQTGELTALLEDELVKNGSHGAVLLVNGVPVPLTPFPQNIIS